MKRTIEDGGLPEPKKVKVNKSDPPKKTDDWVFSQPLWMCKACGLHNYCDKTSCFGCKLERPPEEKKPPSPEPEKPPPVSKNGFRLLKPGELTQSLMTAASELAEKQALTNIPNPPEAKPAPVKVEFVNAPKPPRRSRFDRAPPDFVEKRKTDPPDGTEPAPKTQVSQSWSCFHCKMENVAENTECWFCKAGHMETPIILNQGLAYNTPGGEGSWVCPNCNTPQFADRRACFKCRKAKPSVYDPSSTVVVRRPTEVLKMKFDPVNASANALRKSQEKSISHEIFVGNLSVHINEEMLKEAFAKYGPVLGCRKPNDSYGFLEFGSLDKAVKAMNEMDGQFMSAQRIRCQWPKKKRGFQNNQSISPHLRSLVERNDVVAETARPKRIRFEVFVGNLSDHISDHHLQAAFAPFGTIVSVRKPASFAFIQFASIEGALNAVNIGNGTEICGRKVHVQWPKDFDTSILTSLMNGSASTEQIQLLQNAISSTGTVTQNPIASWNCPICTQRNFSKKRFCFRCHTKVDENGKVLDTARTDSRFIPQSLAASTKVAYF